MAAPGSSITLIISLLINFTLQIDTKEVKVLTKQINPRTASLFNQILPKRSNVKNSVTVREKRSLLGGSLEETIIETPLEAGRSLFKRQRPFRPFRPPRPYGRPVMTGSPGCYPWSCVNNCPARCDNRCSNGQCFCSCPEDEAIYEYYDPPTPFFTEEVIPMF